MPFRHFQKGVNRRQGDTAQTRDERHACTLMPHTACVCARACSVSFANGRDVVIGDSAALGVTSSQRRGERVCTCPGRRCPCQQGKRAQPFRVRGGNPPQHSGCPQHHRSFEQVQRKRALGRIQNAFPRPNRLQNTASGKSRIQTALCGGGSPVQITEQPEGSFASPCSSSKNVE